MQRTKWGGIPDNRFRGSGFFRVDERDGVFWLVDPDGGRFLSKGVNTVRFDQDHVRITDRVPYAETCQKKYGSEHIWRAAAADRLASWKFNTIGCWSDELVAGAGLSRLATAPTAALGDSFKWQRHDQTSFPDVFDPAFSVHIRKSAEENCAKRRNQVELLGTFIDNELYWSPDWRGADELLTLFLNLPSHRPGRVAAITGLQEHYRDFSRFNAVWHTPAHSWEELGTIGRVEAPFFRMPPGLNDRVEARANLANPTRAAFSADCDTFIAVVAERYFDLCVSAIKAADPNHLVIGSRFGYQPPSGVIAAAGRYLDVVSFNFYDFEVSTAIDAYAASGKPCLISEFSFRGDDSGLPNTHGGGPRVTNQKERARCFERYVTAALRKPAVVGYHWFEHADQPAEGRFDGENSNYGTVTIEDNVYPELTEIMTRVNDAAEQIHAEAALSV